MKRRVEGRHGREGRMNGWKEKKKEEELKRERKIERDEEGKVK